MMIIKDELRQINLHPLVIYCIVSPKDPKERIEALNRLNRYKAYTRGLFKFQLIERDGTFNEDLTPELIDKIKQCNMFVRLIDDGSSSFFYASNKVNYNLNSDEIEYSIKKFVVDVCMQNISHLEFRTAQCAHQEDSSQQMWTLHRMQQVFQDALHLKRVRRMSWSRLIDDEVSVSLVEVENKLRSFSDDEYGTIVKRIKEETDFETAIRWLREKLASMDEAPSLEESDENAQSSLKRKPTISVEIKQVVKQTLKSGREKTAYGFVFIIDGETASVNFSSKESVMIYVCALLRRKMNEKMYLHEFHNNSKGRSDQTKFKRGTTTSWIQTIYDFIYENEDLTFSDWLDRAGKNDGRPLNQGKSQINKRIQDSLPKSAVSFCKVNTKEDELKDTYYDIQISPENIILPPDLQFAVTDFKK